MRGVHFTWPPQWLHVFRMKPLPPQLDNRQAEQGTGAGTGLFAAGEWSLCVCVCRPDQDPELYREQVTC